MQPESRSNLQPMLPRHPRWTEFIERLVGPEACNFTKEGWTCFGDLRFVNSVLREIGLDDPTIGVSTASYRDHGAYCDCEVVFMAGPRR
jgi:hypothetical protein